MSSVTISNTNKNIILAEIFVPMALLTLGIYHGMLQTFYRAGFIQASAFGGLEYYQGLTLHGVINAIVLTTFFAVAFGNAVMIHYLNRNINEKMNMLSLLLMVIGTLLAAYPMLTNQASVLYTFYPPLKAHPTFYIGATLLVIGSWVAFFNWFLPYKAWQKENPGKKMPLAVIGIMTTFIIWFIATIPVAVEILGFLLPWSLGLVDEINILLTRVLFWFFGHPLVYFWLLPVYVMYYSILPSQAGGKLYSDYAGRAAFMLFIILSIPVGVHHQFTEPGISQGTKLLHAIFTFGVALPSFLTAFTIAASLEYAGWKKGARGLFGWMGKLPYFDGNRYLFAYLICGLIIFIFGGIGGIVNASYTMNLVVHNTAWIPGHFHLTVAGPVFLGILGMSLYLVSALMGKKVQMKGWNVAVPYLWTFGLLIFSGGLKYGGLIGEPRRTNMGMTYLNPDSELFKPEYIMSTHITAIGGIILFLAALVFFVVLVKTMLAPKEMEATLGFPEEESYHDEKNIKPFERLTPWVVVALVLIVFAYVPAINEAVKNGKKGSPPYMPDNPVPVENTR